MFAPVVSKTHGQLANAAATGSVWAETCIPGYAGDGSNVDDTSISARDHSACHGLSNEKTPAQISIENQIPIVPAHVQRWLSHITSGVVHENVYMTEGALRCRSHLGDALQAANVEFQRNRAPAQSGDFFFESEQAITTSTGENNVRASLGQRARNVLSQAATGSRNECYTAREIE